MADQSAELPFARGQDLFARTAIGKLIRKTRGGR